MINRMFYRSGLWFCTFAVLNMPHTGFALGSFDIGSLMGDASRTNIEYVDPESTFFRADNTTVNPVDPPPVGGGDVDRGFFPNMTLAEGGRKVYGATFQSCAVLKSTRSPVTVIQQLNKSGQYGQNRCTNLIKNSPTSRSHRWQYSWGARAPTRGGTLNVFQQKRDKRGRVGQFDCSGFLTAALAAAGLKTKSTDRRSHTAYATASFDSAFRSRNSCFEGPKMTKSRSLKAGDVINASNNHVALITEVGEDPFGIKKISSASQCKYLNASKFDFHLTHSTSARVDGKTGLQRNHISKYKGSTTKSALVKIAREYCYAIKRGQNYTPRRFRAGSGSRGARYASLVRHVGKKKQKCVYKPMKVRGEKCLGKCHMSS